MNRQQITDMEAELKLRLKQGKFRENYLVQNEGLQCCIMGNALQIKTGEYVSDDFLWSASYSEVFSTTGKYDINLEASISQAVEKNNEGDFEDAIDHFIQSLESFCLEA